MPADNPGVPPMQAAYMPYPVPQSQGLAIASMILGILSIVGLLCFVGALTAIPGLITGIMALNRISSDPQRYGGRGMAITGVTTSVIALIGTVIVILILIANA